MISTKFVSAIAAAALLSVASAQQTSAPVVSIPTPTTTLPANAMTEIGCFETGVPLEDHGSYGFQSPGNCQLICIMLEKPVMGLTDGTNCWCGEKIPPENAKTDNSSCDTDCSGTDKNKCGGPSMWWVVLTGTTKNRIPYFEPDSSSSSSAAKSSAAATSADIPKTVMVTQSTAPEKKKSSPEPNKAGIAAGVVVGVVALAAIIGGVVFYLRQKKRRDLEDEHRRQAAANSFMSGGKLHTSNSSMTDSRLDPDFMHRRASNGSIADNEDYSRRILKVTNA